jgi:hypothetical protein
MFETTRLLSAWGDNPKIRPYIEIVEFVLARPIAPSVHKTQRVEMKLKT